MNSRSLLMRLVSGAVVACVAMLGCAEILGVDFGEKTSSFNEGGSGTGGSAGTGPECQNDDYCKLNYGDLAPKCDENGKCVAECQTTAECAARNPTAPHACILGTCKPLLTQQCGSIWPQKVGNLDGWKQENAIFLGVMGDRSSPDAVIDVVEYYFEIFRLAQKQMADPVQGIIGPGPAGKQRPIVLVECDEMLDPVAAAEHLVETVKVPVIFGPTKFTNQALVLENVLAKEGNSSIMITHASMDAVLTSPTNNQKNLAFSLGPPANFRALALAALMSEQEPSVRTRMNKPAPTPLRVALLTKADHGFEPMNQVIQNTVKVGGQTLLQLGASFTTFSVECTTDPDAAEPCNENQVADDLRAWDPDVVILSGPQGLFGHVIKRVELSWEAMPCQGDGGPGWSVADRPLYLSAFWDYTDTNLLPWSPNCAAHVPASVEFSKRVRSIEAYPQDEARYGTLWTEFGDQLGAVGVNADLGFGLTYDAFQFVTYALVALLKNDSSKPFTGGDVANTFATLVDPLGAKLGTGSANIKQIEGLIESGQPVDLQGIFSRLLLDATRHAPLYSFAVICGNSDLSQLVPAKKSNQYFNISSDPAKLEGTWNCD